MTDNGKPRSRRRDKRNNIRILVFMAATVVIAAITCIYQIKRAYAAQSKAKEEATAVILTAVPEPAEEPVIIITSDPVQIAETKPTDPEETQEPTEEETEAKNESNVFVPLPVKMPEADQRIVFDICRDNNISFTLVMALIGCETEFDRTARSTTGDSGYMQINDCNLETMRQRGFTDMNDTAQNVGAGVSMLCELFEEYGAGETHKVLMVYNMGPKSAKKLWAQGVTSSKYSRKVTTREAEYSAMYEELKKAVNENEK